MVMQALKDSLSYYYNDKGTYIIVLIADVDAQYRFTHIDVGCNGRVSDGGVFGRSALYHALESGELPMPRPKCLPGRRREIPYFFVADDAFALRSFIMKPYPFRGLSFSERVFNYRLSRARRVVENSFAIAANEFRVLRKPMSEPTKSEKVVLALCALHNFLISRRGQRYIHVGSLDTGRTDSYIIPGEWCQKGNPESTWYPLQQTGRRQGGQSDREDLQVYFISRQGEVSWQYGRM
ncbi:hypothetical protein PR048_008284 [Dryococelus australis]|uniref:DDE Tnp4 domain-containing protein n=1 Tax=Dryococelus australis TaxID=614101 RepID=A0ABQ9HWN9_9NEOP|nr:hypothetical protein PR048_008284 [Dryococelus australis]